jgi:transcriptional regulator with XRE-family HTH domain
MSDSQPTPIHSATDVDRRIASTVKALVSAQGHDVAEVAEGIGLSRASLYQKLKGQRPFKAHEVDALARYLRVRVSDLFDGLGGRLFPADPTSQSGMAVTSDYTGDTRRFSLRVLKGGLSAAATLAPVVAARRRHLEVAS